MAFNFTPSGDRPKNDPTTSLRTCFPGRRVCGVIHKSLGRGTFKSARRFLPDLGASPCRWLFSCIYFNIVRVWGYQRASMEIRSKLILRVTGPRFTFHRAGRKTRKKAKQRCTHTYIKLTTTRQVSQSIQLYCSHCQGSS